MATSDPNSHDPSARDGDADSLRWHELSGLRQETMAHRASELLGPEFMSYVDSLDIEQLRKEYLALHYKVESLEHHLNFVTFEYDERSWEVDFDSLWLSTNFKGNDHSLLVMYYGDSMELIATAQEFINQVTHPDDVLVGNIMSITLAVAQARALALQILAWTHALQQDERADR